MTESAQEALLKAKYGGLLPKKKVAPRDHKYFDSADWALSKQAGGGAGAPPPQQQAPGARLEPKMNPSQAPARRTSQLSEAAN